MEEYITKNSVFNSVLLGVIAKSRKQQLDDEDLLLFDDISKKVSCYYDTLIKNKKECTSLSEVESFKNVWMEIKGQTAISAVGWKLYLRLLYNALNSIDIHIIESIKQLINKIIDHKKSLNPSCDVKYLTNWFQTFSTDLKQFMILLHKRSSVVSKRLSQEILLYNVQLTTCAKFIFDIFCEEFSHNLVLNESRNFISKRFDIIFTGIKDVLIDDIDKEFNPGFINWMDNSLDLLALIKVDVKTNPKDIENLKIALDEVLCHAMSLTPISSEDDRKMIVASIHSILREFKQLKIELEKPKIDPSSINLSLDLVSDKLYLLERRINSSVLNISLNVLSDPNKPLQTLKKYCEDSNKTIFNRSKNDLNSMIDLFDSHVESIIQVGLFASACSTNKKTKAQISSCLASLEILETELIPTLTTLYLEPSESHCLTSQLLLKHWVSEVEILRKNICYIIEPLALSQVLLEEYEKWFQNAQEKISKENYVLSISEVLTALKKVKVFILVVGATVKDMDKVDKKIIKHFTNIKLVHNELHSALKILPKDDKYFNKRIVKRLHILSSMICRLGLIFTDDSIPFIHFENAIDEANKPKSETFNLQKLKARGDGILKNRSVLYKTATTPSIRLFSTPKTAAGSLRTVQVRKLSASFIKKQEPKIEENVSLDLHITEILEELTNLADTLSG